LGTDWVQDLLGLVDTKVSNIVLPTILVKQIAHFD